MYVPIKCIQVEVLDAPRSIDNLFGYSKVRALVRYNRIPFGVVTVPVVNGRCNTDAISELAQDRFSWRLSQIIMRSALHSFAVRQPFPLERLTVMPIYGPPAADEKPQVTIAVCTRDRADWLQNCLDAILTTRGVLFEVIVVDNAPATDATRALLAGRYPSVRYVLEPRPGLDWARNRAILEARADIIAFTDDDTAADSNWAKAIYDVFEMDGNVMCVTGLVEPYELETEAQWQFECLGGFGRGFDRHWYRVSPEQPGQWWYHGSGRFGTGANMAYRKSVFDKIGMFDPALDVGTPTGGGGDLEMYFRVLHEGYTLVYEPSAMVLHKHRKTYKELVRQIGDNRAIYSYFYKAIKDYPDQFLAFLNVSLWYIFQYHAKRVIMLMMHRSRLPRRVAFNEMFGFFGSINRYKKAQAKARDIIGKFGMPEGTKAVTPRGLKFTPLRQRRIGIRNVDLVEGVGHDKDSEGYATVRVFVSIAGISVGYVDITNNRRALVVDELLDRVTMTLSEAILETIAEKPSIDPQIFNIRQFIKSRKSLINAQKLPEDDYLPSNVSVSVILATCDRPRDLRICLNSLSNQVTRRPVEIIVVDNKASSGISAPIVAEFPSVKYITEDKPGSSYARNAGVNVSTGDIIVTTDDDVTHPPDWLETLVAPFSRADIMAVAGNILPFELQSYSQWQFEAYGGLGKGYRAFECDGDWFDSYQLAAVPTWNLGATANAAFRASIFSDPSIGHMAEHLGAGMPSGVGEDSYLIYRILQAGYTVKYEHAAFVWHRHRSDIASLRRQIYNYSRGHICHHLTTLFVDHDFRALYQICIVLPMWRVKQLFHIAYMILGSPAGQDNEIGQAASLIFIEIWGNLLGPISYYESVSKVEALGRSPRYVSIDQRAKTFLSDGPGETVRFSIVISSYNCSSLVSKSLESVLNQTFLDWQAIVVDNGSTDDSVAVVRTYCERDPRITLTTQPHSSVASAHNAGIARASGEWLLFLDSGDWIESNYLSRMANAQSANPEIDLFRCGWTCVTPEGAKTEPRWTLGGRDGIIDGNNDSLFETAASGCPFIISACTVRRELVLEAGGFDTSLSVAEDWDLWQKVARLGAIPMMINESLVCYSLQAHSFTFGEPTLLKDSITVLRRGYGEDTRLPRNAQSVGEAATPKGLLERQVYLAIWTAGTLIGRGDSAFSILDEIQDCRHPLIDPSMAGINLMNGLVQQLCCDTGETYKAYQKFSEQIVSFAEKLEVFMCHRGLGRAFSLAAARYSIEQSFISSKEGRALSPPVNEAVGEIQAVTIDISCQIPTIRRMNSSVERLFAILVAGKNQFFGDLELPFVNGSVAKYVIADAIALKYAANALDRHLSPKAYSQLNVNGSNAGYRVLKDGKVLVEQVDGALLLGGNRDTFVGGVVWDELFGDAYSAFVNGLPFDETNSSALVITPPKDQILALELSQEIPALKCSGACVDAEIRVAGLPVGMVRLDVGPNGMVTPGRIVKQILDSCAAELLVAVVTAAIIGRSPLEEPYSLRERLKRRLAEVHNDIDGYIGVSSRSIVDDVSAEQCLGIAAISADSAVIGRRSPYIIGSASNRRYNLPGEVFSDCSTKDAQTVLGPLVAKPKGPMPSILTYCPELFSSPTSAIGAHSMSNHTLAVKLKTDLDAPVITVASRTLPILMYHRVAQSGEPNARPWRVTPGEFEKQLLFLRKEGYYTVTLEEWEAACVLGKPLEGKPILLTFDDGYVDFAEHAWPLLKKFGMGATVFIVAGLVGQTSSWESYLSSETPLMDWSTIRGLLMEGCDFGSHTLTHVPLTSASVEAIAHEAIRSKAILESELGCEIRSLAFPYGYLDQTISHLMGACGYSVALGIGNRLAELSSPLLASPRVSVDGTKSLADFATALRGR